MVAHLQWKTGQVMLGLNYFQTSVVLFFVFHRQLHVMDETHVINQVKEDVCYVSQDFYKDMDIAKYVYNGTKCKSWYS